MSVPAIVYSEGDAQFSKLTFHREHTFVEYNLSLSKQGIIYNDLACLRNRDQIQKGKKKGNKKVPFPLLFVPLFGPFETREMEPNSRQFSRKSYPF